jgi:signal transduction histidine kinase
MVSVVTYMDTDSFRLLILKNWRDASGEGLLGIDSSGAVVVLNSRLQEWFGLDEVPATVTTLLTQTQELIPELGVLLAPQDSAEQAQWGTICIQKYPHCLLSWQQITLQDGDTPAGTLYIFRDRTVHEGQLELAKQSFLSMISHDLRTPLSTILGFAELLYHNRGNLSDDEQKEFIEHIIKNASELSRYTQIALDIMFLEANLQKFETEPVYLDRFVKHWLSDALHRFPAQRLIYHNGATSDPMAHIAPAALHRILYILAEFALAESPPNDLVEIHLKFNEKWAHILVQHKAPNLSAEDTALLFQLVQTRDLSEAGRPKLHRMQLYVASLLAQRQQGQLTLRGRDDHQFQIDLSLPLATPG